MKDRLSLIAGTGCLITSYLPPHDPASYVFLLAGVVFLLSCLEANR